MGCLKENEFHIPSHPSKPIPKERIFCQTQHLSCESKRVLPWDLFLPNEKISRMKFGIKNIILGSVLVLLLVSVGFQAYVMIGIRGAKKFVYDATKVISVEGVNAADYWENNSTFFIGPTAMNLIAMGLWATLFIMA
ncbi:hypothetical protein AVEN_122728-1 [Araneus ventricosus]|uniref:Uncharacterized protein n=1 Tax=Araneus ventricosus TaxID=182803 RepID=A0A4Y1ZPJ5_ARAVE|nr:hypothetical protein AVEN_122728-1 [Araneus ventricosus]